MTSPEIAARLSGRNFAVVETKTHYLVTRGECIALVERTAQGIGSIGSTGLLTRSGLAYLVWDEGRAFLSAKAGRVAAEPHQVEEIRRFSADLKSALE